MGRKTRMAFHPGRDLATHVTREGEVPPSSVPDSEIRSTLLRGGSFAFSRQLREFPRLGRFSQIQQS
ncbi:hypothetical protein FKM82_006007 [Ascaphus truei]